MTFDFDKNTQKTNELWARLDSTDMSDPEYTARTRAYLAESGAAIRRTLDELARLEKRAADEENLDPCDEDFMEDIST